MNTEPYSVRIGVPGQAFDELDDNVDVAVDLPDGTERRATFFTLRNLETLFARNAGSGECGGGQFLWADNMIIVRRLSVEVITATIRELFLTGEFDSAFRA